MPEGVPADAISLKVSGYDSWTEDPDVKVSLIEWDNEPFGRIYEWTGDMSIHLLNLLGA